MMASRIFLLWLLLAPGGVFAQAPDTLNADVREVAVVTGRIEQINPFGRSLVLRTTDGLPLNITAGRGLTVFDQLKAGDTVTVRTTESVVIVPKPHAKT